MKRICLKSALASAYFWQKNSRFGMMATSRGSNVTQPNGFNATWTVKLRILLPNKGEFSDEILLYQTSAPLTHLYSMICDASYDGSGYHCLLGAVNQTNSITETTFLQIRFLSSGAVTKVLALYSFQQQNDPTLRTLLQPLAYSGYITVTTNWTNNFTSENLMSGNIYDSYGNYNGTWDIPPYTEIVSYGGQPTSNNTIWFVNQPTNNSWSIISTSLQKFRPDGMGTIL